MKMDLFYQHWSGQRACPDKKRRIPEFTRRMEYLSCVFSVLFSVKVERKIPNLATYGGLRSSSKCFSVDLRHSLPRNY